MKVFRFLLFPFAILYNLVTSIRNLFFDVGVFKETSFKIPVIVVGNLSVGGTGKTPQIEYLIRLLNQTYKTAVLSRGYKRKTKGFVLLNKRHTAKDVGDEPLQYFKKFINIDIAVDANRVAGISKLIETKNPEVILLDDAYQHRKVKGSFYILLTKYNDLFIDDFLIPTGNLRESSKGGKRADVILVTKCPKNLSINEQNGIKRRLQKLKKEVFFTTISYADTIYGFTEIPTLDLKKYEVLLITGIANPTPFKNYLNDLGVSYHHLKFSDHHHFSDKDLQEIKQKFEVLPASKKIILTTEKDYVRLEGGVKELCYLPIKTTFFQGQNLAFDLLIKQHLKEF